MADIWSPAQSTVLTLQGPTGKLQAQLETPAEYAQPLGIALVCHPHPQFGGTMTNKVVHVLSRSALGAGLAALRFNYRGVGDSEGTYDEGIGETEDALSLFAWLRQQQPTAAMVVAGFSFGAAVALRVAARESVVQLVTIAPPLNYFDNETIPVPDCPWLVVHGDADEVVDCAQTRERLDEARLEPDYHVIHGAGHFFHGRLPDLRDTVEPTLLRCWDSLAA